jgi:Transcriptional regulator containing an amidase domain and an AraC-type DNA-binding HTH domain
LNRSPARYYVELRLNRARLLLLQTNMSVIDVALACGFVSASHFSKCYRDFFGKTPRRERGLPQLALCRPRMAASRAGCDVLHRSQHVRDQIGGAGG